MKKCSSEKPIRRSIRIKDYDYSRSGAYFVTICTQNRKCLLGQIEDGRLLLSASGEIVRSVWMELPTRFSAVTLDEYVIMPNHIHGILLVGAQFIASNSEDSIANHTCTLGEIIRAYKATVTRLVRTRNDYLTDAGGINPAPTVWFGWQRNYYEHVIRNDEDLRHIREYITQNPLKWELDEENPLKS